MIGTVIRIHVIQCASTNGTPFLNVAFCIKSVCWLCPLSYVAPFYVERRGISAQRPFLFMLPAVPRENVFAGPYCEVPLSRHFCSVMTYVHACCFPRRVSPAGRQACCPSSGWIALLDSEDSRSWPLLMLFKYLLPVDRMKQVRTEYTESPRQCRMDGGAFYKHCKTQTYIQYIV